MDNKEILSQVLIRADEIKYKKSEKRRKIGSAIAGVLSVVFILCLSVAMPSIMQNIDADSYIRFTPVASLLSNPALAGYVIVGVVSFVLGVVVTLLCYKWKKKNERK
jgi:Na+/melibiose symporter-like transporter